MSGTCSAAGRRTTRATEDGVGRGGHVEWRRARRRSGRRSARSRKRRIPDRRERARLDLAHAARAVAGRAARAPRAARRRAAQPPLPPVQHHDGRLREGHDADTGCVRTEVAHVDTHARRPVDDVGTVRLAVQALLSNLSSSQFAASFRRQVSGFDDDVGAVPAAGDLRRAADRTLVGDAVRLHSLRRSPAARAVLSSIFAHFW